MAKAPAKTTGQAVAKTNEAPASVGVLEEKPDYLLAMEGKGAMAREDNFDSSDVVIPRIKLLQGLSKECELFDTAKAGRFWHTGMDLNLGESIEFVICARRKKLLLVAPLDDGQGILARAEDCTTWDRTGSWEVKLKDKKQKVTWEIDDLDVAASGLSSWGTSDPDDSESPPAATLFYDYLVILPAHLDLGPAVISLARSQIKKAKKGLNDKIQLHTNSGRPMQAVVFGAKAVDDQNTSNQAFKNWHFAGAGFATEALYKQAKELSVLLQNFAVKDEEDVMGDEAEAGDKVDASKVDY